MKAVKHKVMLKALRQALANLNLEDMHIEISEYRLVKKKIMKKIMENKNER